MSRNAAARAIGPRSYFARSQNVKMPGSFCRLPGRRAGRGLARCAIELSPQSMGSPARIAARAVKAASPPGFHALSTSDRESETRMVSSWTSRQSVRRNSLHLFRDSARLTAETFVSAQAYLDRATYDRPSCLVLDVHLPGLDGLELQRTLAEHEEQSVFITGNGDVPMCAQARKAGARTTRRFSPQSPAPLERSRLRIVISGWSARAQARRPSSPSIVACVLLGLVIADLCSKLNPMYCNCGA